MRHGKLPPIKKIETIKYMNPHEEHSNFKAGSNKQEAQQKLPSESDTADMTLTYRGKFQGTAVGGLDLDELCFINAMD